MKRLVRAVLAATLALALLPASPPSRRSSGWGSCRWAFTSSP
jgi:hypothetical protein